MMLTFAQFLGEAKATKAPKKEKQFKTGGSANNANGVRHELLTAGILNHMVSHHSGSENHDNLLEMNDEELKNHFDNHVSNGTDTSHPKHFENSLPKHFRDKDGSTPTAVYRTHTQSLSPEEHFNHFRNAVHHVKKLHEDLDKRGYNPKTLGDIHWTSVDGNVNSFMNTIGGKSGRVPNKSTDDSDLMGTIKKKGEEHKDEKHALGASLKWGSGRNIPTAKNNTHNTFVPLHEFGPEHHDILKQFDSEQKQHISDHKKNVNSIYPSVKGDKPRKQLYKKDLATLKSNPNDSEARSRVEATNASYKLKTGKTADALHNALTKIHNSPNGTEAIRGLVRRKLQIPNPDFVATRAQMVVGDDGKAKEHKFEDHSVSLDEHLKNAHHFTITHTPGTSTINIHAHDKDGNKLFSHEIVSKNDSRPSDVTTKYLSKVKFPPKKKSKKIKESFIASILSDDLTVANEEFSSAMESFILNRLEFHKKETFTK